MQGKRERAHAEARTHDGAWGCPIRPIKIGFEEKYHAQLNMGSRLGALLK